MTSSSAQPRISAWTLHRVTLFLAFAGIFVAGYLTLSSFMKWEIPCLGQSNGCQLVEQSKDSKALGLPVALYGLIGYFCLAGLGVARSLGIDWNKTVKAGLIVSALGTLISAYLTYDAIVNLQATCVWCLGSASIMTLSFLTYGFLSQREPSTQKYDDKTYIVVLAVLAVAGIGARFAYQQRAQYVTNVKTQELPAKIEDLIPPNAHIKGSTTAPVIIIEFGDLLCPVCKKSYNDMANVLQASNGNVEFVFRQFPLIYNQQHKMAASAAVMSELAAEKGKFWDFLDQMYGDVDQEHVDPDVLRQVASSCGVSADELSKRLADTNDPAFQIVDRDMKLGMKLGIDSTPTLFIGMRGQAPQPGGPASAKDLLSSPPFSKYVRGLQ